ncbi:hypothetical protein [Candidatus Tisiphia endosymbiont of Beris chalybata]
MVYEGQLQEERGVAKSSSAAYYKVREQRRSLDMTTPILEVRNAPRKLEQ